MSGTTDETLLRRLRALDEYEFERLVSDLWAARGWQTRVTRAANDRGVDVVATRHDPFQQKQLIQAKRYAAGNKVGSPEIQQYASLRQQESNVDAVIVVTTSDFTRQAQETARDLNVKLVNGTTLCEQLARVDSDIVERFVDDGPTSPSEAEPERSSRGDSTAANAVTTETNDEASTDTGNADDGNGDDSSSRGNDRTRSGDSSTGAESSAETDERTRSYSKPSAINRYIDREAASQKQTKQLRESITAIVEEYDHTALTADHLLASRDESDDALLNRSVVTRLEDDEDVKLALFNTTKGVGGDRKQNTVQPDAEYGTVFLVTDERLLVILGAEAGDRLLDVPLTAITDAEWSNGIFKHRLLVETETPRTTALFDEPIEQLHLWIDSSFSIGDLRTAIDLIT